MAVCSQRCIGGCIITYNNDYKYDEDDHEFVDNDDNDDDDDELRFCPRLRLSERTLAAISTSIGNNKLDCWKENMSASLNFINPSRFRFKMILQ